jgi:hypothetical protein
MERYNLTNSVHRIIQRLENGLWSNGCCSNDEYQSKFTGIVNELSDLGTLLDSTSVRRLFVKHLPERLQQRVREHCGVGFSVIQICCHSPYAHEELN